MDRDEQTGVAGVIILLLIVLIFVSACASGSPPEPQIRTVEVSVPVQVPCEALKALGAEPDYPDTEEALLSAPNLFERVRLMAQGRLLKNARLAQYAAARASCL